MDVPHEYIGKGILYAGAAGQPLFDVGQVGSLTVNVDEDVKELLDTKAAGGGKINIVSRIKGVKLEMELMEYSPANLAMALRGTNTAITSGAVTSEAITAHLGALCQTAFLPDPASTMTVKDAADAITYVAGTDYNRVGAGIVPLTGGAIVDAAILHISYTKAASNLVQALVQSQLEFRFVFDGLNEAQSGKAVTATFYRVKMSPGQNIGLIGADFQGIKISGESLKDATVTGAGVSQYFTIAEQV
jgi:hypothetical protein